MDFWKARKQYSDAKEKKAGLILSSFQQSYCQTNSLWDTILWGIGCGFDKADVASSNQV